MKERFLTKVKKDLHEIKEAGLYKPERIITSPQGSEIRVKATGPAINFCANNYLGLANNPELIKAATEGLAGYGFGLSSVRFICGTLDIHKKLEGDLARFLGMEEVILYPSCFDANGGLFETLFSEEDAIISDSLNHASIIDGIRLCKAKRFRYANNDMADLERKLQEAKGARFRVIATDGVFSMDGIIANLKGICDLADAYDALVMVDDCHATGFVGAQGRGSAEHCKVMGRIDILTGTLGKALGGASGGFIAAKKEIVELLRQRSRPYLFSNAVAPMITSASIKALELVEKGDGLRQKLKENSRFFRAGMEELGFTLVPGEHPIIPVMLGDAKKAAEMARLLLEEGIYVISFSFPVVPQNQARIRTQMSAAHEKKQLILALEAFAKVGRKLGLIPSLDGVAP